MSKTTYHEFVCDICDKKHGTVTHGMPQDWNEFRIECGKMYWTEYFHVCEACSPELDEKRGVYEREGMKKLFRHMFKKREKK